LCTLDVILNAKMSSFSMDACTETFATLIKLMASYELKQHLAKVWHGLRQSVIDDSMYEWHKRMITSTHLLVFRSKSVLLS